ncbi:MAG: hypothetical protein BLM47_01960 [Candidatus Reconcilbacillus cellulovorans]|uniref:Uncharacterized protein n=1 Tax=Candidatus Reconcilbacillus cellulovorans TaxID=1906605 RepID=A0A2A6E3M1_9BACL|nr:MAG: hypothetical protein BLM47_01960 [Candidatus Reconcilbacillus cellulovorans]
MREKYRNILDTLPKRKKVYLFWKLKIDPILAQKSEEEFLKYIQRKSFDAYRAWERTEEYKHAVVAALNMKLSQDLVSMYQLLESKVKEGDLKAIDAYLKLSKEVASQFSDAKKFFEKNKKHKQEEEEDESDDLIV